MMKKIYDKENKNDILKISDLKTLKELMVCIIPGTKIKWVGEIKKYKCIARDDRYIIVAKPYNPKPDMCQYSILDIQDMVCSTDNLIFGMYNYLDKNDCDEALKELNNGNLALSQKNMVKIEDFIEQIWIEVEKTFYWNKRGYNLVSFLLLVR